MTSENILCSTLTCLGGKIKDLGSVKDMWDTLKVDAGLVETLKKEEKGIWWFPTSFSTATVPFKYIVSIR